MAGPHEFGILYSEYKGQEYSLGKLLSIDLQGLRFVLKVVRSLERLEGHKGVDEQLEETLR